VPHPVGNAFNWEYALRFRGPIAEVELFTVRVVQTVNLSAGNRHPGSEARCVNRQRSYNDKVPRSRAWLDVVLGGAARSSVSADSSIELVGVRRCVGGQAPKPAVSHRGPSFNAATRGELSCQGAEAASERLGVRQSNYRFERSMMAFMAINAVYSECRIGAAIRGWRSAQPER